MSAANNRIVETMNKDLLTRTKALVEALEDDTDLAAEVTDATFGGGEEGDPGAEGALPPPSEDDVDDLPPEPGAEGGPEDEALGLLRDIASGIGRLADEIAPVEELEGPSEGGEFGGENDEFAEDDDDEDGTKKEDEPGVPPVDDDEDEFVETMPVASGA